jgi:hypothetical protein
MGAGMPEEGIASTPAAGKARTVEHALQVEAKINLSKFGILEVKD